MALVLPYKPRNTHLGVMVLKRAWFNVDLLWAGALVGAGVITLVV